jgi:AraC family transcriptional regulator
VSVVHVRCTGPYHTSAVEAWQKLHQWLAKNELSRRMKRGFGLFHDNPQITRPEQLRYDACTDIGAGVDPDFAEGMGRQTLPGGAYAVHVHVGSYDAIGQLFSELHREWVPKQGMKADYDRPFLAIHLNDPVMTREVHRRTELCVPVMPLALAAGDADAGEDRVLRSFAPPAGGSR